MQQSKMHGQVNILYIYQNCNLYFQLNFYLQLGFSANYLKSIYSIQLLFAISQQCQFMQHIKLWVHAALYALVKVHHCTEKLTNTNQESKRALLTPYRKRTETYTSQAEPVAANSRAVGQFLSISREAFI